MGDSGAGDTVTEIEKFEPSKTEALFQVDVSLLTAVHGLLDEANVYVSKSQFTEALECFAKALALNPPEDVLAVLYYKRSGVHKVMGNWTEVIQDTTAALEKRPLFVSALFRRKEAHKMIGRFEELATDLLLISYIGGFDFDSHISDEIEAAFLAVGRVEADKLIKTLKPRMPPKQCAAYLMEDFYNDPVGNWWNTGSVAEDGCVEYGSGSFAEAVALFHAQDYSKIIELCTEELADSGSEFKDEASLLRGVTKFLWCYNKDEYFEDFDTVIESTTAKKSLMASAWMRKGIAYAQRLRNKDEAMACFDKALELNPESVDAIVQRAHAILEFGNDEKSFAEAMECVNKTMEILPGYSHADMMQGFLRFAAASLNNNKPEMVEALKTLTALTEKYPTSAYLHNAYGFALKRVHEPFSANAAFSRASKLDPENSTYRAQAYMAVYDITEDTETALAALNSIVEVDDQAAHVYEHIGNLKHVCADVEGAKMAVAKGLEVAYLYQDFMTLNSLKKAMEVQGKVIALVQTHIEAQDKSGEPDHLARGMATLLLGV